MTVVLDTCAIIWAVSDPEQLSPRAVSLLEADDTEVCVSAISCAEIACAANAGASPSTDTGVSGSAITWS